MTTEEETYKLNDSQNSRVENKPKMLPAPSDCNSSTAQNQTASLNTEEAYYRSALFDARESLDRRNIFILDTWADYLFNASNFPSLCQKDIRNRCLLRLLLGVLVGQIEAFFHKPPPRHGSRLELPEPDTTNMCRAAWEFDYTWDETLEILPPNMSVPCSVHDAPEQCPKAISTLMKQMDEEFHYFLYLARPYAALLEKPKSRTTAALWLQLLCSIRDGSCLIMKGIRNDYMQVLLGYLQNQNLQGLFRKPPPFPPQLQPLQEAATESCKDGGPVTDPTCDEVDEFLSSQPVPTGGAFCYVAITGDLVPQ